MERAPVPDSADPRTVMGRRDFCQMIKFERARRRGKDQHPLDLRAHEEDILPLVSLDHMRNRVGRTQRPDQTNLLVLPLHHHLRTEIQFRHRGGRKKKRKAKIRQLSPFNSDRRKKPSSLPPNPNPLLPPHPLPREKEKLPYPLSECPPLASSGRELGDRSV